MRALLTEEQILFAAAVERFVAQEYKTPASGGPRTFERARLRRIGELGGLALAVPAELGGIGGAVEAMLMMERVGPALASEPLVANGILAANLLAGALARDAAGTILAPILAGERMAVVAYAEDGMRRDALAFSTKALRSGPNWILHGHKVNVTPPGAADILLAVARIVDPAAGEKHGLFSIAMDAPGLRIEHHERFDGLAGCDVFFDGCAVPASARIDANGVLPALAEAIDRAEAAEAAEMVGIMQALLDATRDHLLTRRQFGAPLASFQVLQHRFVDMWIAIEEARSLALAAAFACGAPEAERRRAVSMAKVRACDAARLVAGEAVQMHGAMGMTDDLAVGRWFKRLWALRVGTADQLAHLRRLSVAQ